MKVIRLKRGYRITLSDTEYEMLNDIVVDGVSSYEGDDLAFGDWPRRLLTALRKRQEQRGSPFGILWTDEDRRHGR